jgi:DNA modification methylase
MPLFNIRRQSEIKQYCHGSLVNIRCEIKEGDSAVELQQLADNSIDLIVTSPP